MKGGWDGEGVELSRESLRWERASEVLLSAFSRASLWFSIFFVFLCLFSRSFFFFSFFLNLFLFLNYKSLFFFQVELKNSDWVFSHFWRLWLACGTASNKPGHRRLDKIWYLHSDPAHTAMQNILSRHLPPAVAVCCLILSHINNILVHIRIPRIKRIMLIYIMDVGAWW